MIQKLRKKFLIAAIVSVFLVLLLLIGSINALNYLSLVTEADETLQILSANKGSFPRQMFREQDLPSDLPSPPPEEGRGNTFEMRRGGNGELAYQSRYFAVWFDDEGDSARINLNTATKEQLMTLSGIGESKAQSILDYRKEKGKFSRTEDIMNIPGIKQGVYDKIKDHISV